MAMFPALMNDTMFSDLFDDPFFEGWRNTDNTMSAVMPANMMTTDVRETDKGYDVDIDMPGFKKEDINLELNNGYLTVSASRCSEHEDKAPAAEDEASDSKCACASDSGKWLRRERYMGSCSRSFYVGEDVRSPTSTPATGTARCASRFRRCRPSRKSSPSTKSRLRADDT